MSASPQVKGTVPTVKVKTRSDLLALHKRLTETARELMERKNKDYGANEDVFRNFRAFERFGILVRMSDKLARLQTFLENKEFAVVEENLEDTVLDIINYAVLFAGYDDKQ